MTCKNETLIFIISKLLLVGDGGGDNTVIGDFWRENHQMRSQVRTFLSKLANVQKISGTQTQYPVRAMGDIKIAFAYNVFLSYLSHIS